MVEEVSESTTGAATQSISPTVNNTSNTAKEGEKSEKEEEMGEEGKKDEDNTSNTAKLSCQSTGPRHYLFPDGDGGPRHKLDPDGMGLFCDSCMQSATKRLQWRQRSNKL